MPKAVVKNGQIIPLEPLPPEWKDGTEINLEAMSDTETELDDTAAWIRDVELAASAIAPDSERSFLDAIRSIREEAKLQARREMGATG